MKLENSRGVDQIVLSIVVPTYNEEEAIESFYYRITPVMQTLALPYEVIFVNDGSRDHTSKKLLALQANDSHLKIVDLSRNFGQEVAQTAGIDYACGEAIVLIHADLQDPPEVIPEFVKKWQEGYHVVYGTRTGREGETWLKKTAAILYSKFMQRFSHIHIPANTGEFRLMSRRAIEAVKHLREQHRFMRGLFTWIGFRQTSVPYQREPRFAGSSKLSCWKLWNFGMEGIISFCSFPLQIATYLGLAVLLFSFGYAGFVIFKEVVWGNPVSGYTSIMITVLFIGGIQLITLGIIGQYVWRIYMETKKRPLYFVQRLVGFGKEHNTGSDTKSNSFIG